MRPGWDEYFMAIAKIVSTRSTCNSRPTGAIIVRDKKILTTGYNGAVPNAPHCIDTNTGDETPYCFRRSIGASDSAKYKTLAPCYTCLKLLAVAGIEEIYYEYEYRSTNRQRDEYWEDAVNECGFRHFKQIEMSDDTISQIWDAFGKRTSRRRIE